jgi:hypothetical protein
MIQITFISARKLKYLVSPALLGILLTIISTSSTNAQDQNGLKLGCLVMVGGRYDNLRMCVATDSGVKGGPIADVMLTGRHAASQKVDIGFNLPVFRPILFAAAFKMLQFEPEMVVCFHSAPRNDLQFTTAPSVGLSLHYGPNYRSDRKNRSPSFFAAGPIIGVHFLMGKIGTDQQVKNSFGIKPFYSLLFSKKYSVGTVVGGALEYIRSFP